jgi:hypothetical protein
VDNVGHEQRKGDQADHPRPGARAMALDLVGNGAQRGELAHRELRGLVRRHRRSIERLPPRRRRERAAAVDPGTVQRISRPRPFADGAASVVV